MTVTSTTNRVNHTGNGSTTAFPFTFRIFSSSDLVVTLRDTNGVETTKVLNSDYTVTNSGYAGGTVTMTTAPASGYTLVIKRVLGLTQTTSFRNQGSFYPEIHEDAFDKNVMLAQQVKETLDRSVLLPETSTGVSVVLPAPSAGRVLGWNPTGTALINLSSIDAGGMTDLANTATSTLGDYLVGVKSTLTGGSARTQHAKNADWVSVKDFGAVGDGTTDDTTAIQAALTAITSTGSRLVFPAGVYRYSLQLTVSGVNGWEIEGYGATLKAVDALAIASANTGCLTILGCNDWAIRGLTIDGNRSTRATGAYFNNNLTVENCNRWLIADVTSNNSVYDGFYVGPSVAATIGTYPTFGILTNCKALNSTRQGISITGGFDLTIEDCVFSGTTGLAPQAGVDIEANSGSPATSHARIRFSRCTIKDNAGYGFQIMTSYSTLPRDTWVEDCVFTNNTLGAVSTNAEIYIRRSFFYTHAAATRGIVDFAAVATAGGVVEGCAFYNNTGGTACVYTHTSAASGIQILGNRFYTNTVSPLLCYSQHLNISKNFDSGSAGSAIYGAFAKIEGNTFLNCTGIAISLAGDYQKFLSNTIDAATGRAIYCSGVSPVISNNTIKDVATVVNGYIDLGTATGAVVECNKFYSTSVAATTLAIYGVSAAPASVMFNEAYQMHTTQPYSVLAGGKFGFNTGGTANNTMSSIYPLGGAVYTTAGRPAATSVQAGTWYWDSTLSKPGWSNGTNWKDATGTNI